MQVRKERFPKAAFWGFKTSHLKLKAMSVCYKAGGRTAAFPSLHAWMQLEILCKWGQTVCSLKKSLLHCCLKNIAVNIRNLNFLVGEIALRVRL